MKVYAMGDLHLAGGDDKPMDVFGDQWKGHADRIRENWRGIVCPEDIVLVPGDVSWAMYLSQAGPDLEWIGSLPGRKVLIRGNHDYWWSAIGRVREAMPPGMYALQNDALMLDGVLFAGSRGWLLPAADTSEEDRRIFSRELIRMEMSLAAARRLDKEAPVVMLTHYPPAASDNLPTPVTELLDRYGVSVCVYGHLHGGGIYSACRGQIGGVRYCLTSCDSVDFSPVLVYEKV